MNSRQSVVVATVMAVLAACGTGSEPATTSLPAPTSPPEATSTVPSTTTTTPPTTSGPDEPSLDGALPATFVAVTVDYEAVEVDTATGEVVRPLGQISTAEDVATAECAACVNAIDAVWRTFDGSYFIISECCEPAAGRIHVLTPAQLPLRPGSEVTETHAFWWATPSPRAQEIAYLGYSLLVAAPGAAPVHVGEFLDGFAASNVAWAADGRTLWWLQAEEEAVALWSLDLDRGETSATSLPELSGWTLSDLATRASGELLAVRRSLEGGGGEGVVLTTAGSVVGDFDIEDGARLGGYDPGGTFLIYTTGAGVVRWQGEDGNGVLGDGFLFASW